MCEYGLYLALSDPLRVVCVSLLIYIRTNTHAHTRTRGPLHSLHRVFAGGSVSRGFRFRSTGYARSPISRVNSERIGRLRFWVGHPRGEVLLLVLL